MRLRYTIVLILFLLGFTTVVSQPCLPDGITFTTQSQIDSFPNNYPNCTEIEGSLIVKGNWSDIVSLDSLSSVVSIGGSLEITWNEDLTDLSGLDNITIIGGSLNISDNEYLTSLSALQNLVSIGGDLIVEYNSALTTLSGLENINSESINNLIIYFNYSLSNCQAVNLCDYLSNPNGFVRILSNGSGCFDAPEMADSCGIILPCLPYGEYRLYWQHQVDSFATDYPECNDLNGVVEIGQWVSDLSGLSNIQSINGGLQIRYCHILPGLQGLENLEHIEDSLLIFDNEYILDLNGLNGLNSVNGGVKIANNDAITSLIGLDSLHTIGGNLEIEENHYLSTLDGIDNIEPGTIENLTIVDNWFLTKCNVHSICDYLVSPNGTVEIADNKPGCNSQEEVEEACTVGITEQLSATQLSIYPNPTSSAITISAEQGIIDEVSIYNKLGQRVIHEMKPHNTINISGLPHGLYIVEVVLNGHRVREKLIVQ